MLLKKERVVKGRAVKKATGIPHAVAMSIGKMLVKYTPRHDILKRYPEYVKTYAACGDPGCCGVKYRVVGPKGEFDLGY